MKKIYNLIIGLMTVAAIAGCEENELSHTEVTPVTDLYAPENNAFFNLGAQSAAVFEWAAAKAADNGVVLYEVAFDVENGDFSAPIFKLPSDGQGLQRTLTLSFSDLNKIAVLAGIQPEAIGKLKWTVLSSKGINTQPSMASSLIEVERPAGFPPPDELYMLGTGTEVGDELANGMLMKKIGSSIFEIYTSLKPGNYYFAERNSGTPDTYYLDGDKLKADGTTEVTGPEQVYRIRVDFSNGTSEIATIETIELWFPPLGQFLFDLPYIGNGTWKIENTPIEFKQESWGRDERYKFRFAIKQDGADSYEWFGSVNGDNSRPDDSTADSFWYMVPVTDDFWANCFKFATPVDNNNADISIVFNTSVPEYTHIVEPQ
ncbi:SusE domain-containing protein [Fulvivirgaceae bacterium BMA12]|uniref:SusE domain-containing protein n=1 Tax=Agaribacillus aureus TaxID=3051825 RepID=A0ABT8KZ90_9BACT|nr:SusE domain-containing protein [Fulvivirgaceae bacterium BMA12]